jgi:DNA-directed RNA polymerase specialized sigma24 family protein
MLMLFYAEELTLAEISLVLDLPVSRVDSTLDTIRSQARAALSIGQAAPV